MKTSSGGLRCALIGADTLLVECGRVLLERGHDIVSVATGSARVEDWATMSAIPVHDVDETTVDAWADVLRKEGVDYILAITHLQLLPAPVVSAARRMAINFHDGPLPDYAGLNTPVWGILRGETEWGVSWHRIDGGVDTGEVLVQRRFAIAERETSLSLNTRNFEEALDSFGDVLDMLEADGVQLVPQDAGATRTLFRRADRPDGILDFGRSAAEVDRIVRALHFGPHPNPVAAAVLWSPDTAVVVGSSEIAVTQSSAAAGTVLAADDDGLTIACSDGAVHLSELATLDGTRCGALDFLRATGVKVGRVLPALTDKQREWLADFATETEACEAKTIAELGALAPAEFPWPYRTRVQGAKRATSTIPLDGACTATQLVRALVELLSRLTPDAGLDVALAQEPVPAFARPLVCTAAVLNPSLAPDNASSWRRDLIARTPRLSGRTELRDGLSLPIGVRLSRDDATLPDAVVVLQPSADGGWEVEFDPTAVDPSDANEFARCIGLIAMALGSGAVSPAAISLLSPEDHDRVIEQWNATDAACESACIHDLIAAQAAAGADRQAVVCGDEVVTYRDLLERSSRLAAHLQQIGVGPDTLVGVHVDRSIDLVVAVLGVLQAGGAYVPLDPAYPVERLRHMIADSGTSVVVCRERHRERLPLPVDDTERQVVEVSGDLKRPTPLKNSVQPSNLAYCIYTSGSAGVPKGVLIEHRNVANLFAAMDAVVPRGDSDTWFAVTSLSFDISVLELLYTLARGIRVVLYVPGALQSTAPRKAMDFSLFYFSADEAADPGSTKGNNNKYRLLLEGARFADANGFCAVWTPERHFHAFGGLYPNPAVTAAAIATITERVAIRAGSVVLPLHHPVEVAETWSMVDNLSNGRVGVAFASGWQPNDFVLRPQNYARAKETMFEGIEQIRRLWRGETLLFEGPGNTKVDVATLPRPVQADLPMWITTAGHHDSFAAAGAVGANVLTHLVGQSIDQLAPKIAAYREARAAAGHNAATGVVTLMLHTFIGDDAATVRATVREPLRGYLSSSFNLLREHAWAFPTFRRPDGTPIGDAGDLGDDTLANLGDKDLDAVLDFAAERYYESSGLFGTPEQVLPVIEKLHRVGVDEIACLVDFGVDTDAVLANLPHLAHVRELVASHGTIENSAVDDPIDGASIANLILASGTTHLQCTPSMARMFTLDPAMRAALGKVQHLFVGGEVLPIDLAGELHLRVGGTVTNMYGPTETTVWSSTWPLQAGFEWVPIGTPIANTQMYVLDAAGHPTPPGVAGQLWIGGGGVARGYHQRPELTAERFRPDPFRENGRMYCTGDLARWHAQPGGGAVLEFLGRSDQQVKLRGHRIELGEVEAELRRLPDVVDCAAVVRQRADDHFDQQLVAYVVTSSPKFNSSAVRDLLRTRLPDVMVPSHVVVLPALPRTPNGKLDRRALPAEVAAPAATHSPATSDVEHQVLADWQQVLGTRDIGIDDNFFDAGGHSLLVVRLHRALQQSLVRTIALTDLYRFPTVRAFAASLARTHESSSAIDTARERAARRKATSPGRSGRGKP